MLTVMLPVIQKKSFDYVIKIIFTAFLAVAAFSLQGYSFNHSEIKWKSVSTTHFNIHYYDKTEPAVYATWKIAEEAYASLIDLFTYSESRKIQIALADYDDYSNGFASWTEDAILIWVPDAFFDLRGSNTWLRNVIVHELTHIMSLERKRGIQLLDWVLGGSYSSSSLNVRYEEPIALTAFFPNWFVEGTAQLGSQRVGSDCWDNKRDMVLRCAVLDNTLLTLDEMGNFTHDYIGDEMVYNQGYSLTKFLKDKLSDKEFARIWNETRGRKFNGKSLKKYLREAFNLSLENLYNTWKDTVLNTAKARTQQTVTPLTPVWTKGRLNALPRVSPDGRYWGWLTNDRGDFSRTDLLVARYGENSAAGRIAFAKTAWDFSADGNSVYYVKSRTPDKHGSFLNDIFCYSLASGKETRLTRSARVYALSACPDGKSLACVTFQNSVFSCELFSLEKNQFIKVYNGVPGEPVVSVSCIPSNPGVWIVSRIVSGKPGLFTLDIRTQAMQPLAQTTAVQESPFCARDGRIYYSADYDGIFNIYSVLPDGSDLKRHTAVMGGAFSPVQDNKGKMLVSEYTSRGFRIASCSNVLGVPYTASNSTACQFKPLPVPTGQVKINAVDYKATFLRPAWEIVTMVVGIDSSDVLQSRMAGVEPEDSAWNVDYAVIAQVSMYKSDALRKKDMALGAALMIQGRVASDTKTRQQSTSGDVGKVLDQLDYVNFSARPDFSSGHERFRRQCLAPGLREKLSYAQAKTRTITRDSAGNNENQNTVIPLLVPFTAYENRMHTTTFGILGQAYLVLILPYILEVQPYAQWHIARDLYAGVSPTVSLIPLNLFMDFTQAFSLQIPVWMQWDYHGYVNEDSEYNQAGVSQVRVLGGIQAQPYSRIVRNAKDSLDTTAERVTMPFAGIELFHAFPLFKYGALALSNSTQGLYSDRTLNGRIGTGDSTEFRALLLSITKASFTFPIIRNINSGRVYADNLYGTVFYQVGITATGGYFSRPSKELIFDKQYSSPDADASHIVGVELKMGTIKYHNYQRMLNTVVSWDIFHEQLFVDLALGF